MKKNDYILIQFPLKFVSTGIDLVYQVHFKLTKACDKKNDRSDIHDLSDHSCLRLLKQRKKMEIAIVQTRFCSMIDATPTDHVLAY